MERFAIPDAERERLQQIAECFGSEERFDDKERCTLAGLWGSSAALIALVAITAGGAS